MFSMPIDSRILLVSSLISTAKSSEVIFSSPVSAALAAIGSKNITSIKNASVVTAFFTFRKGLHII